MEIVIRPVTPAEYDAVAELTAQAYLRDGLLDFGESDAYLHELRDVAKRAAAAEVLVAVAKEQGRTAEQGVRLTEGSERAAEEGERVVGGVTFVPSGGPMADIAGPGEAEIRMLAVAHEARRRGVGAALVRACVDRARATPGCVRVVLSSQRAMRSAHRVYERLGFVRTPGRDWNPLPELDDITLLTYELTL
ncbi:GNAT family N-acetyltransferase [Streptomyces sp. NPDC052687]|uniref:GNAT family N-acetyltransferase n=1 Tax=Streptomyces sp. NPDC052687 TaxID=3154759 RepID=UPI0034188569